MALLAIAHFQSASAGQSELLDRLLQLEADHGSLCAEMPGGEATRSELSETAGAIQRTLAASPSSDKRSTDPKLTSDVPHRVVAVFNDIVFNHLGIHPSRDLHDPCNLFLSSVLARKEGYCVGIAAVYLVLAEQLDLPIHALATPSHVFLRYDDGETDVNVETFQQGASVPASQYIAEQKIAPESIRKGIFLRALTADEFLAQVQNNLGVIYSERGDFDRAAVEYEEALRLAPRFPAAWYNWGKDLQRLGDLGRAVRCFSKCLRLHPNDVWALNNRGLAYRRLGKEARALRDFEAALRIDPGFEASKLNLEARQR